MSIPQTTISTDSALVYSSHTHNCMCMVLITRCNLLKVSNYLSYFTALQRVPVIWPQNPTPPLASTKYTTLHYIYGRDTFSTLQHQLRPIYVNRLIGSFTCQALNDPCCQSTRLSVCVSATLLLNISVTKQFKGFVSNREPIGKCLRCTD